MDKYVDSHSWQDGYRALIDEGLTNREIAERLNLSRGGTIKMASAVAQARRWRNAVTGSARQQRGGKSGPKDRAVVDELKRRAAASRGGRRGLVGWQAAVRSKTDKRGQGNRGQELAPFVFPQAAADAIARGDMDAAGAAFEAGLIAQYGADGLEITDFGRLDMEF
ncbi:hypothetical protein [Candidatus Frankia alpina]|nr:hypothetical protein [Candidatus Frankia alpina]